MKVYKKLVYYKYQDVQNIHMPSGKKSEVLKINLISRSVIWLDLGNTYGSVPHAMIEEAMEFFWLPEEVQKMLKSYCNGFQTRFTTNKFITDWQRWEVGVTAGCTISVILFVLALKSTNT